MTLENGCVKAITFKDENNGHLKTIELTYNKVYSLGLVLEVKL
jgi:hypothetical protein